MCKKNKLLFFFLFLFLAAALLSCKHPPRKAEQLNLIEKMKREVRLSSDPAELGNKLNSIFRRDNPRLQIELIDWLFDTSSTNQVSRFKQPHIWAMLNLTMGEAYRKLLFDPNDTNNQSYLISKSIDHYRYALDVLIREEYPYEWAAIHNNLSETFLYFTAKEKEENIEKAIEHIHNALQIRTQTQTPFDWAMSQLIAAKAYRMRVRGNKNTNLLQTVKLSKQALQIIKRETLPEEFVSIVSELSQALVELGQYSSALSHIDTALEVNESRFQQDRLSLTTFDQDIQDLFANAVWSSVQIGDYDKALQYMEWGKTRQMRKDLALDEIESNELPQELYYQLLELKRKKINLKARLSNRNENINAAQQNDLLSEIKNIRLQSDRIIQERNIAVIGTPDQDEIQKWISLLPVDSTLIAPVFSDFGTVVFIVPAGTTQLQRNNVLIFDNFSNKDLHYLIRGAESDQWGGYIRAYSDLKNKRNAYKISESTADDNTLQAQINIWQDSLDTTLEKITQNWLEPTLSFLQNNGIKTGTRLIWIPDSISSVIPLHSASVNNRPLLSQYHIQFVPSLYSFFIAQQNLKNSKRENLLAVVNPTGDLNYASFEGAMISRIFATSAKQLNGPDASKNNLNRSLNDSYGYLHMATHGTYNWRVPQESYLSLAHEEKLTLDDLLSKRTKLNATRLVVLSACESGFTDFDMPTESIGLPLAFLRIGAAGVISTLWEVDDISTAFLMIKFYQLHHTEQIEPAIALAQAQMWLRSITVKELQEWLKDLLAKYKTTWKGYEKFNDFMLNLREVNRLYPDKRFFEKRYYWGGFVYIGT